MSNLLFVSAALAVFGPWQHVTPETMRQPVPESVNVSRSYGSVMPAFARKVKAVSGCPVYESGVLVGYSFRDCHQKDYLSEYQ